MRQAISHRDPLLPIGPPALPVASARPIAPTAQERERLKKMAYGRKNEHRLRTRAHIVLHAARGSEHTIRRRPPQHAENTQVSYLVRVAFRHRTRRSAECR